MNLNRRKFLQNFFLSAALLLLTVDVFADSGELPEYCSLQGGLTANGVELLRTSGNPDLDRSISLELSHVAKSLKVFPGFGFYDDADGPNAFAIDDSVIPNTQGTVIFGKQLLSDELTKRSSGGLAIAGIIAHEFAHIYQYQSGLDRVLGRLQKTNKLIELHADYLAGYYLGLKRLTNSENDIKVFLDALYLRGDTHFNSPTHHGTPFERKQVMLEGYKIGLTNNTDVHQVAEMGMELVKGM